MIEFNVNHNVLVKLNDKGIAELERQHEINKKESPLNYGEFVPPKTDKDGWVKFQMHDLMHTFGHMMFLNSTLPFDTNIRLLDV